MHFVFNITVLVELYFCVGGMVYGGFAWTLHLQLKL